MIDRMGYKTISEYLDNEYPKSTDDLLTKCMDIDLINDQTAEFGEPESHEAREVKELTAYRLADILDHLESVCGNEVLGILGRETVAKTAEVILARVVVEFRAIARHRADEIDHNCEAEFCPQADNNIDTLSDEQWDSYNDLLTRNSGSMPITTQINETAINTDEQWESEWR